MIALHRIIPSALPPTTTHVRTTTGIARTQTYKHPSGTGMHRNASYIEDRGTIQARQDRASALSPWVSQEAQLSNTSTCGPGFAFGEKERGETRQDKQTDRKIWTVSAAEFSRVHTTSFLQRPLKTSLQRLWDAACKSCSVFCAPCDPGIPRQLHTHYPLQPTQRPLPSFQMLLVVFSAKTQQSQFQLPGD